MTRTELATTIADETVTDLIKAVAARSPKHVPVYEARRGELVAMILEAGDEQMVIDKLRGEYKFSSLRAWAQETPGLMAAYVEIGNQIAVEVS